MSTVKLLPLILVAFVACGEASPDGAAFGTGGAESGAASTSGDPSTGGPTAETGTGTTTETGFESADSTVEADGGVFDLAVPDLPRSPASEPSLFWAVGDVFVAVTLDASDGSVQLLATSSITNDPPVWSADARLGIALTALTMLPDGALLGARGLPGRTQFFLVSDPPTDGQDVEAQILGEMDLFVEALHTDCEGRVYLMDTGADEVSAAGNRLLRFTADYIGGDFAYDVVTDLSVATIADIDDMSPSLGREGVVADNPGLAIDTGVVFDIDYTIGEATEIGAGGSYGIHALGGALFDDGVGRLYLLHADAQLFEADPNTLALSDVLATGPLHPDGAPAGLSGLAGPMTDCETGFPAG